MSDTKAVERIEAFKKEFLAEGSECTWKDYPLATDVLDWLRLQEQNFHQELQKAREEEKSSILKLALTMGDCPINNPEADAGWMKFQHDFCLKLTKDNKKSILSENDQSELDQPARLTCSQVHPECDMYHPEGHSLSELDQPNNK